MKYNREELCHTCGGSGAKAGTHRKRVISVEVVDKLMLFVIHRLVGCKLKQLVMSVMEQVRKLKKNAQLVMVQVMKKLHILLK